MHTVDAEESAAWIAVPACASSGAIIITGEMCAKYESLRRDALYLRGTTNDSTYRIRRDED